jgi:hypothetical protein
MNKFKVTSQKEVRKQFWAWMDSIITEHMTDTDIRCSFVDFVDVMQKDGVISEALANKVTLKG